ncbi:MAG: hypothetical protein QF774_16150 [Nitrospinota bacterium]|jgi:hypothetical protein|nr:hypothetical protein [Nitrospinota bacterium]
MSPIGQIVDDKNSIRPGAACPFEIYIAPVMVNNEKDVSIAPFRSDIGRLILGGAAQNLDGMARVT